MYLPPATRPIIGSPFSLRNVSEFNDVRSVPTPASSWSLLFTLDRKPGVPGVLLGAVFAAVFAAVTAAVCAEVVPVIVPVMDAFRGVTTEPVRGVTGLLPGALRATLYDELALDTARDPGLEERV